MRSFPLGLLCVEFDFVGLQVGHVLGVFVVGTPQGLDPGVDFGRRGRTAQNPQEHGFDDFFVVRLAGHEPGQGVIAGSAIASAMVGPLTSVMIGPSIMPLERSHSHELSRAGRPNNSKNPLGSVSPTSGNWAAR